MTKTDGLFDLSGKTAIVTGASYGLGVTLAECLGQAGANVVLAARSLDKLEALAKKLEGDGVKALAVECDVAESSSVRDMVEKAREAFGRIDILVNNAGVNTDAGMMPEKMDDAAFEHTVRVNLLGLWYCTKEVGATMLTDGKGGAIINISSIAGMTGWKDYPPAYQATKAAVINLTRNLAMSWADRGVRVNAIAPGYFPSEMTGPFLALDAFKKWVESSTPLGRIGELEELVGPLLFLASDASSYVTGHTLVVDGGYTATAGYAPFPEDVYTFLGENIPDSRGIPIKPNAD